MQGRTAAVNALAQIQRLGRAELPIVGGQQLQRHAAKLSVRRQGQHKVLRIALAGEIGHDHIGVAFADDGGQTAVVVLVDGQILIPLRGDVPGQQLLAVCVLQAGGGEAFHLGGHTLDGLTDTPAALAARLQHRKPDIGAGGVGRVQDCGLVNAVTVPVTKRKRGKEIAAGGIFQGGAAAQIVVQRLLQGRALAGKLRGAQQGFYIARRTAACQQKQHKEQGGDFFHHGGLLLSHKVINLCTDYWKSLSHSAA